MYDTSTPNEHGSAINKWEWLVFKNIDEENVRIVDIYALKCDTV